MHENKLGYQLSSKQLATTLDKICQEYCSFNLVKSNIFSTNRSLVSNLHTLHISTVELGHRAPVAAVAPVGWHEATGDFGRGAGAVDQEGLLGAGTRQRRC